MKQASIIMLALLCVALAGCSVLESHNNAVSAQAYAHATSAQAHATETQAIQATAQKAETEASVRLMAFLATVTALSNNPATFMFSVMFLVAMVVIVIGVLILGGLRER